MKKYIAIMLTWIYLLSLVGCHAFQPGTQGTSPSEYFIAEGNKQYLILPISKEKIRVSNSFTQYLDDIDLDLLTAAEEKIREEAAQYRTTDICFYLGAKDGYLSLCAEIIVDITPPSIPHPTDPSATDPTFRQSGCGIDHEHIFFNEQISK